MHCSFCNSLVDSSDSFRLYGNDNIYGYRSKICCKSCIKHMKQCSKCFLYYENDNSLFLNNVCYKCCCDQKVNKYSFKPNPLFFSNDDNDLKIGVELEINGAKTYKQMYDDIVYINKIFHTLYLKDNYFCDFVYLKRDASIGYDGFEIVSHPATIKYHKNNTPWNLFFENSQMKKRVNCGLHFHIDKSFLNLFQIKLLDLFINQYVPLIKLIAGRKPNRYCKNNRNKKYEQLGRSLSRYEMLNFTDNTIEFRFFKSPTSYKKFLLRIEFVDSFVKFIKTLNAFELLKQIDQTNELFNNFWIEYFKYLNDNEKLYPNCYKFLKQKKTNALINYYNNNKINVNI